MTDKINNLPVGIILPHLGPSQINEEVIEIVNKGGNYTIFFQEMSKSYRPINTPLMNITESRYFSGKLICFSLDVASYILGSLKQIEPILYVYDIPWRKNNDYVSNVSILRDKRLNIYTRSEDYADLFEKYANRKIEVKTLEELLERQYAKK